MSRFLSKGYARVDYDLQDKAALCMPEIKMNVNCISLRVQALESL